MNCLKSRLAKEANIPEYQNLSKPKLYKKLQESFNLQRLQRVEARRQRIQEVCDRKRSLEIENENDNENPRKKSKSKKNELSETKTLNKYDPIMLSPLVKKYTWKFVRDNGKNSFAF